MHDGALLSVMPCFSDALRYALSHSCLALSHAVVPCCQSCLAVSDGVMPCCQSWLALSYALLSVVPLFCNCVSCRFATRHALPLLCHSLSSFALSLASIFTRVSQVCILIYTHTHLYMDVFVCARMHVRVCVCVCSYKERER